MYNVLHVYWFQMLNYFTKNLFLQTSCEMNYHQNNNFNHNIVHEGNYQYVNTTPGAPNTINQSFCHMTSKP